MTLTQGSVLAQATTTTAPAGATTTAAPGGETPGAETPTPISAPAEATPNAVKFQECVSPKLQAKATELRSQIQGMTQEQVQAKATEIQNATIEECLVELSLVSGEGGAAGETHAETAAVEEKSGAQMILPQWNEVIWAALAFVVLFGLLAKFAFPAMKKALQKRSDTIQDDLTKAEQAKLEAEGVLDDYRKQLANARGESAKIIEEARKQADELRKDVLAKAEDDAKSIRDANTRDVANAVEQAKAELRAQVAELSIDLAGRLVHAELDASGHQSLIDRFIDELDSTGAQS